MNRFKKGLLFFFNMVPFAMYRKFFRFWLKSIAHQEPKRALRTLLQIDDDLNSRIDKIALQYDGNGIHVKHRLMQYHDFFVERLHPGEQVLDIGCGYGAVTYSMAVRAHAKVTGIDLNEKNIMMARKLFHNPNVTFIHGNVLKDIPEGSYETIVASNVLEHIENRTEFIRTVQLLTKPQRWLFRVPMINRHWLVPLRQELGLSFFSDPTHHIEYTQESFAVEMQNAQLTITYLQINWGEIWAEARADATS